MCLISETNKPTIATEDIVCYKVITTENKTPYTDSFVNILHRLGIIPFKAKGNIKIEENFNRFTRRYYYTITKGMIHTFKGQIFYTMSWFFPKIYKCIIPKGTEYFISQGGNEYCSKKIIFKKRIR